jgi:rhodanese-related sulfurtransferase
MVVDTCARECRRLNPLSWQLAEWPDEANFAWEKNMQQQLQHYMNKLAYEIDSSDLRSALDAGESIIVVDARSALAFQTEHLPGAINIPHRTMNENSTRHLSRDSLIVTYCDGIGCNASTKGALNMTRLGFRVKELIGGLDWWKRDGYGTTVDVGRADTVECGCN